MNIYIYIYIYIYHGGELRGAQTCSMDENRTESYVCNLRIYLVMQMDIKQYTRSR